MRREMIVLVKDNGTLVNLGDLLDGGLRVGGAAISGDNPVPVAEAFATAVAGKTVVTTAGTPVALGSQAIRGVMVEANPENTSTVFVFPTAGAKTDVRPLAAGEKTYFPVNNISALKVDATVNGESVFWTGAV